MNVVPYDAECPNRMTTKNVVEYIEYLSEFDPPTYIKLQNEMLRRTQENTDLDKWKKWFQQNNFTRIREGLLTVTIDDTNRDVLVGEFTCVIESALEEKDIRIIEIKKICDLIKKYKSLISIYKALIRFYPRIDGIYNVFLTTANRITNPLILYKDRPELLGFENLISCVCSNLDRTIPDNMIAYYDSHLEKLKEFYDTLPFYVMRHNMTIVTQDMDGAFHKYLQLTNLNKYKWFFDSFSYLEIMTIDTNNIQEMISTVNRKYGHGFSIKKGSQERICDFIKVMRQRSLKLTIIINYLKNAKIKRTKIEMKFLHKAFSYLHEILALPIPNKKCIADEKLQTDIVHVVNELFNLLIKQLDPVGQQRNIAVGQPRNIEQLIDDLCGKTIKLFFQCTRLITENQFFNYIHIKNIEYIVLRMRFKFTHMNSPKVVNLSNIY